MNQTIDIVALIAILGPIIAAILTWLSARKSISADVIKSDRVVAVEALQKAGELAVQVAEKQAEDRDKCQDDLERVTHENDTLRLMIADLKIRLKARALKIRAIVNRHKLLHDQVNPDCPGYEAVQTMLEDVSREIDEEAKLL